MSLCYIYDLGVNLDNAVMSFQPIATAYLSWLSLEEGGREKSPSGTIYAATVKFSKQSDEFFSVVMRETHQPVYTSHIRYDLDFFAPELIVERLSPGTKLWITEGPRTVAQGEIVSVDVPLINKIRSERTSRV
jgi:hypothetical protein